MEDKMQPGIVNNSANFNCNTYWLYRDGDTEQFEEPEMKKAQFEMGIRDSGYGKKLWVKIFSRVGKDPTHKRDYYNYIEFPVDCNFAKALFVMLKDNKEE